MIEISLLKIFFQLQTREKWFFCQFCARERVCVSIMVKWNFSVFCLFVIISPPPNCLWVTACELSVIIDLFTFFSFLFLAYRDEQEKGEEVANVGNFTRSKCTLSCSYMSEKSDTCVSRRVRAWIQLSVIRWKNDLFGASLDHAMALHELITLSRLTNFPVS